MSVFGPGAAAESNSLAEAVHSLAIELASSRTLRGPYRLVCENHSSLSPTQAAALFEEFRSQLAVAPNLLSSSSTAPALHLTFEETPSRIIILLRVPATEGEQVRLLEVNRANLAIDDAVERTPYAVQQLVWKQREPILSALERDSTVRETDAASGANAKLLFVLGREVLSVYGEAQNGMSLQSATRLPGAPVASRDWSGSIRFATPGGNDFAIDLLGKRCTGTLAETLALKCGPPSSLASEGVDNAARLEPSVSLEAACDQSPWILSSSDRDRTATDRLALVDTKNSGATPTPVLELPGPVLSLGASARAQTAIATVFNLATGEYELYRITLACRN